MCEGIFCDEAYETYLEEEDEGEWEFKEGGVKWNVYKQREKRF
jgi:hypothetical protein